MSRTFLLLAAAILALPATAQANDSFTNTMQTFNRTIATSSPTFDHIAPQAGQVQQYYRPQQVYTDPQIYARQPVGSTVQNVLPQVRQYVPAQGQYIPQGSGEQIIRDAVNRTVPSGPMSGSQMEHYARTVNSGVNGGAANYDPTGQLRNGLNQVMPRGVNVDPVEVLRNFNE